MTHIPILDLAIQVFLQILFGAGVSYCYRTQDLRVPSQALWFATLSAVSILNTYGIQFFTFKLLPEHLDLFIATLVPTAIVLACMFVGALVDRRNIDSHRESVSGTGRHK